MFNNTVSLKGLLNNLDNYFFIDVVLFYTKKIIINEIYDKLGLRIINSYSYFNFYRSEDKSFYYQNINIHSLNEKIMNIAGRSLHYLYFFKGINNFIFYVDKNKVDVLIKEFLYSIVNLDFSIKKELFLKMIKNNYFIDVDNVIIEDHKMELFKINSKEEYEYLKKYVKNNPNFKIIILTNNLLIEDLHNLDPIVYLEKKDKSIIKKSNNIIKMTPLIWDIDLMLAMYSQKGKEFKFEEIPISEIYELISKFYDLLNNKIEKCYNINSIKEKNYFFLSNIYTPIYNVLHQWYDYFLLLTSKLFFLDNEKKKSYKFFTMNEDLYMYLCKEVISYFLTEIDFTVEGESFVKMIKKSGDVLNEIANTINITKRIVTSHEKELKGENLCNLFFTPFEKEIINRENLIFYDVLTLETKSLEVNSINNKVLKYLKRKYNYLLNMKNYKIKINNENNKITFKKMIIVKGIKDSSVNFKEIYEDYLEFLVTSFFLSFIVSNLELSAFLEKFISDNKLESKNYYEYLLGFLLANKKMTLREFTDFIKDLYHQNLDLTDLYTITSYYFMINENYYQNIIKDKRNNLNTIYEIIEKKKNFLLKKFKEKILKGIILNMK